MRNVNVLCCCGLLCIAIFSSCSHTKNIAYFKDLSDTVKLYSQKISDTYEMKIQPDDVVQIVVSSINSEAAAPFNLGNATPAPATNLKNIKMAANESPSVLGASSSGGGGYLVDKEGHIEFPVLGQLQVNGMTTSQLKNLVKQKLDKYLTDPIVNVRLLNNKITVLGEVAHPAVYAIPSERITIIDAIGMAGDLTIYGKRDNVLLIREENGERKFVRLDLGSSSLFLSPYYYLKQNDAIYVEPNKKKEAVSDLGAIRRAAIITSAISALIFVSSRLIK